MGKPLASTVVQRIQRFQQGNLVQRSIFEMIAQELLNMLPPPPPTPGDSTNHSQQHASHYHSLPNSPNDLAATLA